MNQETKNRALHQQQKWTVPKANPKNRTYITQDTVNRLLRGAPEDRIIWDAGDKAVRGFGVRITRAGTVTFILNYHFDGKERRYTIGQHPEYTATMAREEAETLRVDINNGHDPVAERKAEREARLTAPTFKALADAYMEDVETQKRESSRYEDQRMLNKNIFPKLGLRRLSEITRDDIVKLRDSMKDTKYQANRILSLLSSIFNHGIKREWLDKNPAKGVERFEEQPRESYLSLEQLQRFREALDNYPCEEGLSDSARLVRQDAANALKLLLLTGSRMSEVLMAMWEEFDFERDEWVKPSHHTKQKKQEHVPLSAEAIKLLESMAPKKLSGPLFPGKKGTREGKETGSDMRVSLRRPWIEACKAAGLVKVEKDENGEMHYTPAIRIHDLRHNFASHLISNGVPLQVVGKLLGHTQASTTMRYAHVQDAAQRSAANVFGDIYSQKKPKVKKRGA